MNDYRNNYRGRGGRPPLLPNNNYFNSNRSDYNNTNRGNNENARFSMHRPPFYRGNVPNWQQPNSQNFYNWRRGPYQPFVRAPFPQMTPNNYMRSNSPISTIVSNLNSSVPDSEEEARQRAIAEASARIKEQLNLTDISINYNPQTPQQAPLPEPQTNVNISPPSPPPQQTNRTPKRKPKRTVTDMAELRKKILTHLSKTKIQNLVNNPGSSRYDAVLKHLVRETRQHLSLELRNMYNNRETNANDQNMVPDLGVDLNSLPDTVVQELSKILQLEVRNETENDEDDDDIMLIEPEDMFKQAEQMLRDSSFMSSFETENQTVRNEMDSFQNAAFDHEMKRNCNPDSESGNYEVYDYSDFGSYTEPTNVVVKKECSSLKPNQSQNDPKEIQTQENTPDKHLLDFHTFQYDSFLKRSSNKQIQAQTEKSYIVQNDPVQNPKEIQTQENIPEKNSLDSHTFQSDSFNKSSSNERIETQTEKSDLFQEYQPSPKSPDSFSNNKSQDNRNSSLPKTHKSSHYEKRLETSTSSSSLRSHKSNHYKKSEKFDSSNRSFNSNNNIELELRTSSADKNDLYFHIHNHCNKFDNNTRNESSESKSNQIPVNEQNYDTDNFHHSDFWKNRKQKKKRKKDKEEQKSMDYFENREILDTVDLQMELNQVENQEITQSENEPQTDNSSTKEAVEMLSSLPEPRKENAEFSEIINIPLDSNIETFNESNENPKEEKIEVDENVNDLQKQNVEENLNKTPEITESLIEYKESENFIINNSILMQTENEEKLEFKIEENIEESQTESVENKNIVKMDSLKEVRIILDKFPIEIIEKLEKKKEDNNVELSKEKEICENADSLKEIVDSEQNSEIIKENNVEVSENVHLLNNNNNCKGNENITKNNDQVKESENSKENNIIDNYKNVKEKEIPNNNNNNNISETIPQSTTNVEKIDKHKTTHPEKHVKKCNNHQKTETENNKNVNQNQTKPVEKKKNKVTNECKEKSLKKDSENNKKIQMPPLFEADKKTVFIQTKNKLKATETEKKSSNKNPAEKKVQANSKRNVSESSERSEPEKNRKSQNVMKDVLKVNKKENTTITKPIPLPLQINKELVKSVPLQNNKEVILNRMMAIDLKIQKLMEEKMNLYKALQMLKNNDQTEIRNQENNCSAGTSTLPSTSTKKNLQGRIRKTPTGTVTQNKEHEGKKLRSDLSKSHERNEKTQRSHSPDMNSADLRTNRKQIEKRQCSPSPDPNFANRKQIEKRQCCPSPDPNFANRKQIEKRQCCPSPDPNFANRKQIEKRQRSHSPDTSSADLKTNRKQLDDSIRSEGDNSLVNKHIDKKRKVSKNNSDSELTQFHKKKEKSVEVSNSESDKSTKISKLNHHNSNNKEEEKLSKSDSSETETSNQLKRDSNRSPVEKMRLTPCFVQLERITVANNEKESDVEIETETEVTSSSNGMEMEKFGKISVVDLSKLQTERNMRPMEVDEEIVDISMEDNGLVDESIDDEGVFCEGHKKSILDIKLLGNEFLAASEDGTIYKYCLRTGYLQDAYTGHTLAVTCMFTTSGQILDIDAVLLYSGSLDCTLRCFNVDTAEIVHSVVVEQAIQCMDSAWNHVFLGTYRGLVFIYNIKKKLLHSDHLIAGDATILMIKATQEGSRHVLIMASRKREITVRDAFTGLLLRTMADDQKLTVYSLYLNRSTIYCGTSDRGILALDFHSGVQTNMYKAGKGVVCMVMQGSLLFAGCYDGKIYVYDIDEGQLVDVIQGPGDGMLLSLAISEHVIIASTKKDFLLKIWKVPNNIANKLNSTNQ